MEILRGEISEKLSWGVYDFPSPEVSYVYDMQVAGKARGHGVEGGTDRRETPCSDKNETVNRTFIVQLTDTRRSRTDNPSVCHTAASSLCTREP